VLAASAFVALIVAMAIAFAAGCDKLATFAIGYVAAAATVIVYARRRLDLARVGIAWPHARFVVAGALVGISMWYVELRVIDWLPISQRAPALEQELGHQGLAVMLLVIALLPALTEELVFRGVLARGLATCLPALVAITASSIVFALIHGNPPQMIATFLLGCTLGFIAIRSGSIAPTVLAHFTNNALVTLITRDDLDFVVRAIDAHPDVMLVVALALVGAGIALAAPHGGVA